MALGKLSTTIEMHQVEAESGLRKLATILITLVTHREHQLDSYSTHFTITGFGNMLLLRFSGI